MTHIHWVSRQNKLEIPGDKDEVNKREIHECDGRAHDPDTMVVPLTPKPTRKTEPLSRAPTTIVLCREDTVLRKWSLSRYCCPRCILETKTLDRPAMFVYRWRTNLLDVFKNEVNDEVHRFLLTHRVNGNPEGVQRTYNHDDVHDGTIVVFSQTFPRRWHRQFVHFPMISAQSSKLFPGPGGPGRGWS
jgi:hypothetical protein